MHHVFTGPSSVMAKMIGYSGKSFLYQNADVAPQNKYADIINETVFKGGLFEIFIPPVEKPVLKRTAEGFEADYPPVQKFDYALVCYLKQCAAFLKNAFIKEGLMKKIQTKEDAHLFETSSLPLVMLHFADADAIDEELELLDIFYALGVRSLGITWSRKNKFGYGAPYKLPGHPNMGPGLTEAGIRLVKKCNEAGIIIDNAHLNEAGFRDVAKHTSKPLVISHGTHHALNPSSRTFTDEMLQTIAASNGIVGISLEGVKETHAGIAEDMFRHIDYVAEKAGEDYVGFGSDMILPVNENGDVKTFLPDVLNIMSLKGYSESTIQKIASGNWKRVIENTLQ
jgi:membrane dipeptidase